MPLYLTATALAGLAHKDGELAVTRAAYTSGVIYMVPTLSSVSLEDILGERKWNQI